MRILLITGSLLPMKCGVGDYTYHLANALALDKNLKIAVLTSISAKVEEYGSRIEIFPLLTKWSFTEAFKAINRIRTWSPDIVHIQYPTQGYSKGILPWMLPMISFILGSKVVQTWHEGYSRRDAPWLFLKAIVPGGLVFVRPQYEINLHPFLRWALWKKKFFYIPNASVIPYVELDKLLREKERAKYLKKQKRLIVFFGFVHPNKGVEFLLDIADPDLDHIVIAGEIDESSEYSYEIKSRASAEVWKDKVTITGFIPAIDVAKLLAVADAVILPFRVGGGEWNTSIHGAVLNGTFVLTTSLTHNGYDKKRNIYSAKVDDIQEMRLALRTYAGKKREYDSSIDRDEWTNIAKQHCVLYRKVLKE